MFYYLILINVQYYSCLFINVVIIFFIPHSSSSCKWCIYSTVRQRDDSAQAADGPVCLRTPLDVSASSARRYFAADSRPLRPVTNTKLVRVSVTRSLQKPAHVQITPILQISLVRHRKDFTRYCTVLIRFRRREKRRTGLT